MKKTKVHFIRSGGHRNKPWRVTFCPAPHFKRKTRHFAKKIDAELFAAEMGQDADSKPDFQVTEDERKWLAQFRRQSANAGLSTNEALARLTLASTSLVEMPLTLSGLIADFLAHKKSKGRRPRTLSHYQRMLNYFLLDLGDRLARDISPIEVLNWAENRYTNPNSQGNALTPTMGMFRWAASPRRCLVGEEWLRKFPKTERTLGDKKSPFVFTPLAFGSILHHASPTILPALVLGAFAGLRPEELCAPKAKTAVLQWETIDFEMKEIVIPAEVSKTR